MFNIFGRKSDDKKEKKFLEIDVTEPVDCLGDFTFNFHWQHKGEKLDPSWKIPGNDLTFGEVVEHLKIREIYGLMVMPDTAWQVVWVWTYNTLEEQERHSGWGYLC